VIRAIHGDITAVHADVIVNAANSSLAGGGGVDGAIHRAGGPDIMRELERKRIGLVPFPAGDVIITSAGNLPAKWVFHAVGPIWCGGLYGEDEALKRCYRNCFDLASHIAAASIAFPAISTGVYCFPKRRAAEIAVSEAQIADPYLSITFVLFDEESFSIYQELLKGIA
jgi:O-acetyl-ADP-ribose deacetylase